MTGTLQQIYDTFANFQQWEWEVEDAAQAWDVEYIYIFLGAFIVYIAASAIINTYKHNDK
jgi:hypothetical protein